MLVLLNPRAGGGTAASRWAAVGAGVRALTDRDELGALASDTDPGGPLEVLLLPDPAEAASLVAARFAAGRRTFVAAGGDGTVHGLVNALVAALPGPELGEVRLGAVGLGSSNDFHKPLSERRVVDGVPVRLDAAGARQHDVGRLRWLDPRGREWTRHWIVNGSVGLTADANTFFNGGDRVLGLLKRRAPKTAIVYAALRTLLRHRPRCLELRLDGVDSGGDGTSGVGDGTPGVADGVLAIPARPTLVDNLGVVKNPHFAGDFRYDGPHEPASGTFCVHRLEGRSRLGLVRAMASLAGGRFAGTPGASSRVARRLVVRAEEPFAVEVDGEVLVALEAEFSIHPHRLALCA